MSVPHRFDPTILREYDLRGIVGETLSEADALALGRAMAALLAERRATNQKSQMRVCVARDGRLSSPALSASLIEGLIASGLEVTDLGLGPTPMLYYGVHALAADGGVMVTGSHNAPDYNGFKLTADHAKPIYGDDIQAIGHLAAEGRFVYGTGALLTKDLRAAYVARVRQGLPAERERPLRVGWDAGNGAMGDVLSQIVPLLPGHHVVLNATIDGNFPAHHPDPTVPANLVELIAAVKSERLDLGIAFDGDGDRIGVVDGRGRIVWGDQLVALLARDVVAHQGKTRPIILDVKSSAAATVYIENTLGAPAQLWKTGHSLIKARMAEVGAPLAGEMSGHIFIADDYYGFDDALYAAIRLLALLGGTSEPLSAMLDRFPAMQNTPELRIECAEARKCGIVREVRQQLKKAGADMIEIDGVRVTTSDGWWLLRASNTQPALVARAESKTSDGLERLKAELRRVLLASGIATPGF
ncbi:MAG: phosphomannomutase/phosphoglucomutase [Alphaproteobacteria bacterium]|nr:phosphomannomutase/phosphoglucomutase [Alphaproteobacteria bacterium]